MKTKWNPKRLLGILLSCVMLFSFMPVIAFAEDTTTVRTQTLDLSASGFDQNQENTAEGWSWDAASHTLTLTNANFQTDGYGVIFPVGQDCTLRLVGENTLTCGKQTVTKTAGRAGKVTITGDGSLTATTTQDLPTFDLVNLELASGTIVATGSVNALNDVKISGGSLSVNTTARTLWNDGIYACGSIEITGGSVDIAAGRVGLFVPGTGAAEPKTGLKITGGNVTIQGALAATYVGLDKEKDTVIETTGSITIHDSPVGFYSGKGNITIEKGGNIVLTDVARPTGVPAGSTEGHVTVADADYSEADEAIAKANALNMDEYKDFTAVEAAVGAVDRTKNFLEQATVDGYVTAIEEAIAALEYKDADYSKVDAAIAKANALNKDEYKDFSAVEAAVNGVVRGKNITEQTTVDGYVTAIEEAIAALEYKDADYSKVDAAIAKANALNKDEYKDFSAVEAAVNGVVRGKNITEQTTVDGYAAAIENAITALEKKPQDATDPTKPDDTTDPTKPDDTTDPTKPDDTTKPAETDPGTGTIPKTGDSSDLFLWMALMLVSGIGALGTMVYKKRITDR